MKASLGCALALAGACLAVRVEAQTIVIGPRASSIAAQPGAVFTVPVVADLTGGGGASLGSVSGRLTWRPAALRFVEASLGTAGPVVFNPDTTAGVLRFALANASGATGTAVLVNVTFRVTATAGDTTRLAVSLDELTAAQTFANLLPSAVPTPALFCAAGGRYGDIDGNDSLKSNDALYIVTNAVGLPITPYTVVNGDVDNDGKVDTRDALIVLTHVVGLPTPGFRVGQLNTGGCGITAAKTVSLQPVAATLSVGDQVPLAATARDSTDTITSAAFQWLSRDPAVVLVRPAYLEAVGTGTTRVVVVVAPGVMDSVTIDVTGARRVWYVDQVVAASQPVENGSSTYPFSTLQLAVQHAAAGDTVRVAPGAYGAGARFVRPVVILGDSTAAGIPAFAGPITIDSLAGGTVRIVRIRVADAAAGVVARGLGAGRVQLERVVVERSRGVGVAGVGLAELRLTDVEVTGATGEGIGADSTGYLRLERVHVDAVSGGMSGSILEGIGLGVAHADSVHADSSTFRLGTVRMRSIGMLRLRNVGIGEAVAALLEADSMGTVSLDSVNMGNTGAQGEDAFAISFRLLPTGTLSMRSVVLAMLGRQGLQVEGGASATLRGVYLDGPGIGGTSEAPRYIARFIGVGSVSIAQSWLGYGHVAISRACATCTGVVRVDTTSFQKAPVLTTAMDTVIVRRASFADGPSPLLGVDTGRVVSIVESEFREAWPVPVYYGDAPQISRSAAALPEPPPFAIALRELDSVRVDSSYVHDNAQGVMTLGAARVASLTGNVFQGNHRFAFMMYGQAPKTIDLGLVRNVRVAQNLFIEREGMTQAVRVSFDTLSAAIFVADTNTIQRALVGFEVGAAAGSTSSATLRGTRFEQAGVLNPIGILASLGGLRAVTAIGNSVDTSWSPSAQISASDVGAFEARGNSFLGVGAGFAAYSGTTSDSLVVAENTVRCGPVAYGSETAARPAIARASQSLAGIAAISVSDGPARVDSNVVRNCRFGIQAGMSSAYTRGAMVRRNLVVPDSVGGEEGIRLEGPWLNSVIAQNEVGPGATPGGAILVRGYGAGIDSTVVTGNRVHDVRGVGIAVTSTAFRTVLDADTVTGVRHAWTAYDACSYNSSAVCVFTSGPGTGVRIRGLRLSGNRPDGIRVWSAGDTVRIDSTVVVDDSLAAISLNPSSGVAVVGAWNFLARNGNGLVGGPGTVARVTQSVFQQNMMAGASGGPAWYLVGNYWGGANGPRCPLLGCDTTTGSTNDLVMGLDSLFPFLTTPPATPTGAPPAFRAPLTAVQPALAPSVGATRAVRVAALPERRPPFPTPSREGRP